MNPYSMLSLPAYFDTTMRRVIACEPLVSVYVYTPLLRPAASATTVVVPAFAMPSNNTATSRPNASCITIRAACALGMVNSIRALVNVGVGTALARAKPAASASSSRPDTVKLAASELTVPQLLVTSHVYLPAIAGVKLLSVYVAVVAPGIDAPSFFH